jgi:hypothetical protein
MGGVAGAVELENWNQGFTGMAFTVELALPVVYHGREVVGF